MYSPSEPELVTRIMELRPKNLHMGKAKFRELLKDTYSFNVSEARLKKLFDEHPDLDYIPENENLFRDTDFNTTTVRDAFLEYKKLERKFMLDLSPEQVKLIMYNESDEPVRAACDFRFCFEFLLVLKSLRPCATIGHDIGDEIFTNLVKKCLLPVIAKYKLRRYGFCLQQITHTINMPESIYKGFEKGWIFYDKRNFKRLPLMTKYLLKPNLGEVKEHEIADAIGNPTPYGPRCFTAVDVTEREELKERLGKDVGPVTAFQFDCPEEAGFFIPIAHDYEHCKMVATEMGTQLKADFTRHKAMLQWVKKEPNIAVFRTELDWSRKVVYRRVVQNPEEAPKT
ncbi:hypothetical protein BT63DRAFT_460073 [Microthyrium microscopicum]|uniref:Uncharacterized protein n=1 Tax=Microthyrium microscopicum TaxID=703497 RepID=A0A6A6U011_9PEZI|nr:hypothetical protein BT63DRAFT_460073 [Microthyrium microscopicum]